MRVDLGDFGVWTSYRTIRAESAGEAAGTAEELGYGTFWLGGSPRLTELRPLLESTSRLVAASGIANVWRYEPEALAADHAQLSEEFPGRVLAGIGIGHPEVSSEYTKPVATMRSFLDRLDNADRPVPADERCLAALGPAMLALAADRTRGMLSYFVPVEHTRFAREQMGEAALLAVELACVIEPDAERARMIARDYAQLYLRLRNYTSNLMRFGFSDADITDGGSDRLIDAVIPHGHAADVAAAVRAHLDAGADHVCLQPLGTSGIPRDGWSALASELLG